MTLTIEQEELISEYKHSLRREINDGNGEKLNLIGKDFKDQKIELIQYAQNELIPSLEDTIINHQVNIVEAQQRIDIMERALSDW